MRRLLLILSLGAAGPGLPAQAQPRVPPLDALRPPVATLADPFEHVSSVRELGDGRLIVADDSPRFRLVVVDWSSGDVSRLDAKATGRRNTAR